MSKAFTKEDDAGKALVVPRAPLPPGVPNYVTPRGLHALRAERHALEEQRAHLSTDDPSARVALHALAERLGELEERIAAAVLVEPSAQPRAEVRFGAQIEVENEAGEVRSYRIVGVDEADAAVGLVAFTAPLSRALLGKGVGESAEVRTPRGTEELVVRSISYDEVTEKNG